MNEASRARQLAVQELEAIFGDPVRREAIKPKAIEVRFINSRPDLSIHCQSGGVTQGGYLFFIEDLAPLVGRTKEL